MRKISILLSFLILIFIFQLSETEITGQSPLAGLYEIGTGDDYTSLTLALADLQSEGASDTVIFELTANYNFSGETYPVEITDFTGSCDTIPLIIRAASGTSHNIKPSVSTSIIKFNGAHYVILDASPGTIDLTNTASSDYSAAIWIMGQSSNVTIRNCGITAGTKSAFTYGIFAGGATLGMSQGLYNDSLVIEGNTFTRAAYGIYLYGNGSTRNTGNSIRNNTLGSSTASSSLTSGVICYNQDNLKISENEVLNINDNNIFHAKGIGLNSSSNVLVEKNNIHDIYYTAADGAGKGILVLSSDTDPNIRIVNNMIRHIAGNGSSDNTCPSGIEINCSNATGGITIGHNSIYLTPDATYGLETNNAWAAAVSIRAGSGIDLRSNLLRTSLGERTGNSNTVYNYAVYAPVSNPFSLCDNNVYYVDGSGSSNYVGYGNSSNCSLTAWRTYTSDDENSVEQDPDFKSTTDLRINATNDLGTHVTGVHYDYYDQLRNGISPDAGAHEISASPAMGGTYRIGVGEDFETLYDALEILHSVGVNAPTIFELTSTYDPSDETYPITIQDFSGASASNTLTIKPATGTSHNLTYNFDAEERALFELEDADWVIIDGSADGSGSRDMTISNITNAYKNAGIWFKSMGDNSGCCNNVIKNCIFNGNDFFDSYGVLISDATFDDFGEDNDNNSIVNNEFFYLGTPIKSKGGNSGDPNTGNTISNNIMGSSITNNYLVTGMNLDYESNLLISGNEVYNIYYEGGNPYGMKLSHIEDAIVEKNNIHDIIYTGPFGNAARGINIYATGSNPNIIIRNNMISHITGMGDAPDNCPAAIHITAGTTTSGISLYYNSIYLTPDASYGLGNENNNIFASGIFIYSGSGYDVRNNIIRVSLGERSGCTQNTYGYAVYCKGSVSPFVTINRNIYYTDNHDNNYAAYCNSTNFDFAGWQAYNGQDANSFWQVPQYVSETDLNIYESNDRGQVISGITEDIHGITRHGSYPDIGADECDSMDLSMVDIDVSKNLIINTTSTMEYQLLASKKSGPSSWLTCNEDSTDVIAFSPCDVNIRQKTNIANTRLVRTIPEPATAPSFSIDYINEQTEEIIGDTIEYNEDNDFSTPNNNGANEYVNVIPGTDIYFRIKASQYKLPSLIQHLEVPGNPAAPAYSIDFINERTNEVIEDNAEYDTSAAMTTSITGTGGKVPLIPGQDMYFRMKATDTCFVSQVQQLSVPVRPPYSLPGIDYAGEMTNRAINATEEYSTNSDMSNAVDGTGESIPVTPGEDLYFRLKATVSVFASGIAMQEVPDRPDAPDYGINFINERTDQVVSTTDIYSNNADMTDSIVGIDNFVPVTPGTDIYFMHLATADSFASYIQHLAISERPAVPIVSLSDKDSPEAEFRLSIDGSGDRVMYADSMEYSANDSFKGGSKWIRIADTTTVNATGDKTIIVRSMATDTSFASNPTENLDEPGYPPTGANDIVTTDEDVTRLFAREDFTFNDVDGDTLAFIRITGLVDAGSLQYDGIDVTVDTDYDHPSGFAFIPEENEYGIPYTAFTYQLIDETGKISPEYTMTVNVNAVNDVPMVLNAIADQVTHVDSVFLLTIPENTFMDVEDNTNLTLTASLSDGTDLPAWLTFNAEEGSLSGIPVLAQVLTIRITAEDAGSATTSDEFVLTVDGGNNIERISQNKNSYIYPNPNNGHFTLCLGKYQNQKVRVDIYNINGKIVYDEIIYSENEKAIDLSYLETGIYFMNISAKGDSTTLKVTIR